jgi:transposase-like protein
MAGKRKQHTSDFKARVALDAIRGIKTLSELSALHGVHPTVIANWKRQLLEGAPDVFNRGTSGRSDDEEMARLFEQIGRMKMENEWLKKKL